MDTAIAINIILAVLAVALTATAYALFQSKTKSDREHASELAMLNAKLAEASASVGRANELERNVEAALREKQSLQDQLKQSGDQITKLSEDLSVAKTERDATRSSTEELINAEREACNAAIAREKATCNDLLAKEKEARADVLAAKDSEIAAKDKQIDSLKEFIEKAKETLGDQFKSISQATLKDVSQQFEKAAKLVIDQNTVETKQNVELHKEQIAKLLQPMGLTLDQLNTLVKDTTSKRENAEAVLMDKIKEFAGANEKLANALNKPVIRGSFAETKLESLLEAAGLVRGENFDLQVPIKDGDQTRIVDALVHMAQGKKLVIDSKNLLVPFVEFANATDEDRAAKLAEFQKAFRNTVKALSVKDYAKHWLGIDAVIMFLPDEGMYMAAMESDRQLVATMYEHRVFAVSPVSLLPILKSVAYILGLEKQNRDTQTIVDAGRALYESLGVILSKLKSLGTKLEGSVEAYNGVVASFEGNVLPKARRMRQLAVVKGRAHPEVREVDAQPREFRDRTSRELSSVVINEHVGNEILPREQVVS